MNARKGIRKLLAAAGLALGLAAGGFAADAHKHEHGDAPAELSLNDGRKWTTDAPLRKGMENIRGAMEGALHGIHENKFSAAQYGALAKKVNGEVSGIVASCKLEPQADAQLHLVVADLIDGIEAMQGKAKQGKREAGAVKVLGALEKYGSHFEHPGWQPLAH